MQIHSKLVKAFEAYENTIEDLEARREALNAYEDDIIVAYEELLEVNQIMIENER